MKTIGVYLFFMLALSSMTYAQQQQLSGSIKDTKGTVIAEGDISLKNTAGYILAFSRANEQGNYLIVVPDSLNFANAYLEVRLLGYRAVQQPLEAGRLVYHFEVEAQPIVLDEVRIRPKPQIISIGDTLSYEVASFSRPEDRSIGDVIRRLPGITVADNGQISYNGKAISNLYIHGDDLMDGRYGLAPKIISKDMVERVDVMQNHQPIKVLQNKVFTDDVAMNLILKDSRKFNWSGQAMIGGGLPQQFDMALNVLAFNQKVKTLNSLRANNSGIDYWGDLEQLGTPLGRSNAPASTPRSLLSINTVGSPDIPMENYYFNRSSAINANNLYNTGNELQLKLNAQFYLDRSHITHFSHMAHYLPGDTIEYNESLHNTNRPKELNLTLTAVKNSEKYFLNNTLKAEFADRARQSALRINDTDLDQRLSERNRRFSNDFSFTPALKHNNIADLSWHIGYSENPQTLLIDSGLHTQVLNDGIPYLMLDQVASIPTLLSNVSVSYRVLNRGPIRQQYLLGALNEWQELSSRISLTQLNGITDYYEKDTGNDLKWNRNRYHFQSEYSIHRELWDASLTLPFIWQTIAYRQESYQLDQHKQRLFINPSANFRVYVNSEDYLKLSYTYQNLYGNISNVYHGAILNNYRTLTTNDRELPEQTMQASSLYYNFQRSVSMLFSHAELSYRKIQANTIQSSILDNDIRQNILLPFKHQQNMLSTGFGISKYIFALNTTAKFGMNWSRTRYDQFINQTRLPFDNHIHAANVGLDGRFFRQVTLKYEGAGARSRSLPKGDLSATMTSSIWRFSQGLTIGYSPIRNLDTHIEAKNVLLTQQDKNSLNYSFVNMRLRYKSIRLRTDFSLDINNIMGIINYEIVDLTSNQLSISNYTLRGRMGIFRATFNL